MNEKYFVTFGTERVEVYINEIHTVGEHQDYLVEAVDGQKHFVSECSKGHPVRTNWMWTPAETVEVEGVHIITLSRETPCLTKY